MATPKQLTTGADLGNQPLIRVASPVNPSDGATKGYVDNLLAGLAWKQPVRVATTANVVLASAVTAGATLDGVVLAAGNRVLVKDQTTASENGIYVVTAGAPTRATDGDTTAELNAATVYVIAGTVNADRAYTQTANDPTVGTTALAWAQVGGGTAYTAGGGLSLSGTTFAVSPKANGGIVADGTGVSIDPAYPGLVKRYAATLAAGGTSTAVTHNLGTTDLTVALYDITGAAPVEVEADVVLTSANVLTIGTAAAVTASQYRVVVVG